MRWFWIDKFLEFNCGQSATATKHVSLSEDHLHDQILGHLSMPNSLILEGLAQTGGLLYSQCFDFRERVVLAKIGKVEFFSHARPGETLTYHARLEESHTDGAMVLATSGVGGRKQGTAEMFFAILRDPDIPESLFEPYRLLDFLKNVGLFDVARRADGAPLDIPQYMLESQANAAC
jgi:3-hydroxyacyl-[acyl-carrier-protein] dehydratase